MDDMKMQDLILRALYGNSGREATVVPTMFNPPIMLSQILRIGGILKKKNYTTAPVKRLNGWHFKLLEAGISYCETQQPVSHMR